MGTSVTSALLLPVALTTSTGLLIVTVLSSPARCTAIWGLPWVASAGRGAGVLLLASRCWVLLPVAAVGAVISVRRVLLGGGVGRLGGLVGRVVVLLLLAAIARGGRVRSAILRGGARRSGEGGVVRVVALLGGEAVGAGWGAGVGRLLLCVLGVVWLGGGAVGVLRRARGAVAVLLGVVVWVGA